MGRKKKSAPVEVEPEPQSSDAEALPPLSSDEESPDESEDDEGALVTRGVKQKVLETIERIKNKDPAVYDAQRKFFNSDEEDSDDADVKKKEKPLRLKDYKVEFMLQRDGRIADDSDDEAPGRVLTHEEEQRQLKENFIRSAAEIKEDSDDEALLRPRKKSAEELAREEAEAAEVRRKVDSAADDNDVMARLLAGEDADVTDKYLRDYVLNERWKDKKGVPTYEQIVRTAGRVDDEDAAHLEEAEAFEEKYNFRFEEEDGGNIITYPREIPGTVRRKDEKRKESRKRKQEQEAALAQQKEEERRARFAKVMEELEAPDCQLSEKEKKQRYLEAFVESLAADDEVEGVKVPFNYTDVQPNTFGMTVRDILDASDSELDVYVPIRGLAPYREKEWKPKFTARPKLGWQKRLERKQQGKHHHHDGGEDDTEQQWQNEGLDEEADGDAAAAGAADDHERQTAGKKKQKDKAAKREAHPTPEKHAKKVKQKH